MFYQLCILEEKKIQQNVHKLWDFTQLLFFASFHIFPVYI